MKKLTVELPGREYDIYIGAGVSDNLAQFINRRKCVLITDENVYSLYKDKLCVPDVEIVTVSPGEGSKSLECLSYIYDKVLSYGLTRSDLIVALGGGVVGDLAGFAASTLLRGIPYIQVPTTLLAQVDSSVGGKTAINTSYGKNLIGSFYQPKAVYIDPLFLDTLPPRQLSCGMAEVIKYGAIRDQSLFEALSGDYNMEDIIFTCCSIKADIVQNDEFDTSLRMLLNFGHTLGHGLELAGDFSAFNHGEAISMGMYMAALYGEHIGETAIGTSEHIRAMLTKFDLPFRPERGLLKEAVRAISADKKMQGGSLSLILLNQIGSAYIKKISTERIDELARL